MGRLWKRGRGDLIQPSGLALDDEDNLYVADSGNNRVQRFSGDGEFLTAWGSEGSDEGQLRMPWGITVDGDSKRLCIGLGQRPSPEVHRLTGGS